MWQSGKQERDCLVHFLRLLAVRWLGVESARIAMLLLLLLLLLLRTFI